MNKDDDEHEELEMGRRSRGTRSKNLFGERRSNEEESRAGERRFDKGLKERRTGEEEAAQVRLEFLVDFFSTSVSTACNSSFKNSISILEFEFSTLDMLVC